MKKICKYCNEEIEFLNSQQFGGHITNCKFNPNKELNIKKAAEGRIVERYDFKFNCVVCEEEYIQILTNGEYKKGRYNKCCSKSCSNKKSLLDIDYNKTKKANCVTCNIEIDIKISASKKNCLCFSCKKKTHKEKKKNIGKEKISFIKRNFCKCCGIEDCKDKICKSWNSGRSKTFLKLGFDASKIGAIEFFEEYERLINVIRFEYENNSMVEIGEKFNINYQTIFMMIKNIGLNTRTLSDSLILAYKKGRFESPNVNIYPYKSGYHISWEGNKYWFRSSYELEYCKILDESKIRYEIEKINIQYFDTQLGRERTAVPDFYLIDTNEIVEIKSSWTYNEQNMIDKFKEYRKLGYNVKLILDHKEVEVKS